MLGFSLTSPDLVICAGSPDISGVSNGDSPEFLGNKFLQNIGSSVELSLENGINGSEIEDPQKTPAVKFSPGDSFELQPPLTTEDRLLGLSINAGSKDGAVNLGEINFLEDSCFDGGDTVRTDAVGPLLYQSARFGNFSYNFRSLESGGYVVDLHFAEIVFTEGPPGMRVFDVYIQEKKVRSLENETPH